MKTISIINNKGGVGKTTLTQNLGVELANQGFKVGLIDFDGSGNLSFVVKFTPNKDLASLLIDQKPVTINDFSTTKYKNLYLLPNNKDIVSTLFARFSAIDQFFALKNILKECTDFDFILIDTGPNLDIPTFNAMVAADFLIIAIKFEIFSATGFATIYDNIGSAKRVNPNLKVLGIIASDVYDNRKLSNTMRDSIESNLPGMLFKTCFRTNEKIKQAQAEQTDIITYENKEKIKRSSEDIKALSKEIINRLKILN